MPSESEPVKKAFAQEMLARQDERLHYELMMAARRLEPGTGAVADQVLQWQTAMQRYLACARNSTDLSRRIFLRASSVYRSNPDHLRLEVERLEQQLAEGGLEKGLLWLNARVPHRFTAVYRLETALGQLLLKVLDLQAEVIRIAPVGGRGTQENAP